MIYEKKYPTVTVKIGKPSDVPILTKLLSSAFPYNDVDIVRGRWVIDAKSIMGIFSLNLCKPLKIVFHSNDDNRIKMFVEKMEGFNNGLN